MSLLTSTAIYPNRIEDKEKLESELHLNEFGNDLQEFEIPFGPSLAKGYNRIVYGDHGAYIEFAPNHIIYPLKPKYDNNIDINNLPDIDYKYYYYWLYPDGYPELKVYLQIKPVTNLPNAPRRLDGKKSKFSRAEGYADYKRGYYYIDPHSIEVL